MKVIVASKNPIKIEAVREIIKKYKDLVNFQVDGIETNSGVSKQPKSLEETVRGAINRAITVFNNNYIYSFGIESGLMIVPQTKTGSMDFCACAIYDGINYNLGLSCAFEFPIKVIKMIHNKEIDANEAFYRCGLTSDKKIGSCIGAIGLLTKGRINRKDYTKQSIQMALIQLENKKLY